MIDGIRESITTSIK